MTLDEQAQALAPWRLTQRQARFLVTVALHGGYCLRRQYMAFAGLRYGKTVRHFLDGLVTRRLADRTAYRVDRGYLYHLQARALYRALGQEDNRNRRRTSPAAIARKLMVLDYVIAEPTVEWFATEEDKVALFTGRFGVPMDDLPRRTYAVEGDGTPGCHRYFMHKLPIGIEGDPPAVRFVALALDPTAQAFEQLLRDHARLFSHLAPWTMVLLAPRAASPIEPYLDVFDRVVTGALPSAIRGEQAALMRYFALRQVVDGKDWRRLSVEDLQYVREARARFGGVRIEALYARWLAIGDLAFNEGHSLDGRTGVRQGRLTVHTLPFRYDQFGDLPGVC